MRRQRRHRTNAVTKSIKKGIETWRKKRREVKEGANNLRNIYVKDRL